MSGRSRKTAPNAASLKYKPPPPRPNPPRARRPSPQIALFSRASIGRLLGGTAGGALVLYVGNLAYGTYADAKRVANKDVPVDTSDRYNFTADCFDDEVDSMESAIGIKKLRKQLCSKARGHVLESSVGTGRNMEYLPLTRRGVKSVTMVDKSREMIEVARRKWPEVGNAFFIRTTFRVQDLSREKVPCPSPEGFDTIIQTMGLCSTGEPEKMLQNLGRMTNPDGGQILLLEHGRGTWSFLNDFLDYTAKAHADRHGCWYNKDIGSIVRKSGLEIVEEKRYDWGTTYWYVLRPAPKSQPSEQKPLDVASSATSSNVSWFGFSR